MPESKRESGLKTTAKKVLPYITALGLMAPEVYFRVSHNDDLDSILNGSKSSILRVAEENCEAGGNHDFIRDTPKDAIARQTIENENARINARRKEYGLHEVKVDPDNVFFCDLEGIAGRMQIVNEDVFIVLDQNHFASSKLLSKSDNSQTAILRHEMSHVGQTKPSWRSEACADKLAERHTGKSIKHIMFEKWWDLLVSLAQKQGLGEDVLIRQLYDSNTEVEYDENFLRQLLCGLNLGDEKTNLLVDLLSHDHHEYILFKTAKLFEDPDSRKSWQDLLKIDDNLLQAFLNQGFDKRFERIIVQTRNDEIYKILGKIGGALMLVLLGVNLVKFIQNRKR